MKFLKWGWVLQRERAPLPGDAGLAPLAELKSLEALELEGDNISDTDLSHLAKLPALREVSLSSYNVRGPGLAHLTRLPSLRDLRLMYDEWPGDKQLAYLKDATSLKVLVLDFNTFTKTGMAHLSKLTQLEGLNLFKTPIQDDWLVHLAPLQSLRTLNLGETKVTDKGLVHLRHLKSLDALYLPALGDEGIVNLAGCGLEKLKYLQTLRVSNRPVSDAGLSRLAAMRSLESLWIGGNITAAGVAYIAQLPNLKRLTLFGEPLTSDAIVKLAAARSLDELTLKNTPKVTSSGLRPLAALPLLRVLDIGPMSTERDPLTSFPFSDRVEVFCGAITDGGLTDLAKCKRLRRLYARAQISDAGLAHLANLTNLTDLSIDGGNISDEGLRHLEGLKGLATLQVISQAQLSREAVERLRKQLPEVSSESWGFVVRGASPPKAPRATPASRPQVKAADDK